MAIASSSSPASEPSSRLDSGTCYVCGTECRKRCTQCRAIFYCSVACQKSDWKRHRAVCCKDSPAATAWNELAQLVNQHAATSSLTDLQREYHQANDHVNYLLQQEQQQKQKQQQQQQQQQQKINTVKKKKKSSPLGEKEKKNDATDERTEKASDYQTNQEKTETRTRSTIPQPPPLPLYRDSPHATVLYCVEDRPNLSCYQVLVYCNDDDDDSFLQHVSVELVTPKLLSLQWQESLEIRIPLKHACHGGGPSDPALPITTTRLIHQDRRALSLRLSYASSNTDQLYYYDPPSVPTRLLPAPSQVSCRACGQELLIQNSNKDDEPRIQNVLPMPSGQWEDMEEYLTCADPGRTVMGLSNGGGDVQAKRHCLLQDTTSTAVVFHADDLIPTATCVMAVPGLGYSDDDDDAKRVSWTDAGGATVTCSCCASCLGTVTSLDSYRFWQHQLSFADASLARFVTGELIRYADAQAIFAFSIVCPELQRRLVVQLLSWDGLAAWSDDSRLGESNGQHQLDWRRQAKVYFVETANLDDADTSDPAKLWDVDWCCLVLDNNNKEQAAPGGRQVRLCLSTRDWNDLRAELEEQSKFLDRQVVEATILAKTGAALVSTENMAAGLAVIPL